MNFSDHLQSITLANQRLETLRNEAKIESLMVKHPWALTQLLPRKSKQKRPNQTICTPKIAIK
jgi:hypothetical protein